MELNESNIEIFRKDVQNLAQIDKLIKEAKNAMKPIKERIKILVLERKNLEQEIYTVMKVNNLDQAELPDKSGIIEYVCKQSVVPITQKTIKDKMISFFESGPGSLLSFNSKDHRSKGSEMHDFIYGKDNRDFVTKEQIKNNSI